MITIEEVLSIHKQVILEFGGSFGIRDYGLLKSAIQRPFATFDEIELYPNVEDKASAIIESIVKNHPFIDGNKRTGYVLMRYLLLKSGKDIYANSNEKYDFVIEIAKGNLTTEDIQKWIKNKLI